MKLVKLYIINKNMKKFDKASHLQNYKNRTFIYYIQRHMVCHLNKDIIDLKTLTEQKILEVMII